MWEQMMFRVIIGRILGEGLAYGTRSMQRVKRDAILAGLLTGAVILLLCLFGEAVFPPLRMLRQCFDERTWILGKLLLDLLALPVGAPVGGVLAYRCLKRREERTEKADPVQVRARKIRRVYGLTVEVLLFAWYCFLTPARWWAEQARRGDVRREHGPAGGMGPPDHPAGRGRRQAGLPGGGAPPAGPELIPGPNDIKKGSDWTGPFCYAFCPAVTSPQRLRLK